MFSVNMLFSKFAMVELALRVVKGDFKNMVCHSTVINYQNICRKDCLNSSFRTMVINSFTSNLEKPIFLGNCISGKILLEINYR